MRSFTLIFILSVISFVHSYQAKIIVDLNDEDFEEALLDYEHAMVLFFSPKCVHCKEFMPEFEIAADDLIRNEPPVHSARVDCLGSGKFICKREDIDELPTIKIYKRAALFDEYDGARSAPDLISYLKMLVGITSHELNANGAVNFAQEFKDVSVIAFLRKTGQLREHYFSLPPQLSKDIRFGHYNIESDDKDMENKIKLIRPEYMKSKFEPSEFYYEGDGDDLLEFIIQHRHGLVGLRKPKNVDDFGAPLVIAYYPIDIDLSLKMFSYWRNRILKVAVNYEKYLNFAVSPIDDFLGEFIKFGIDILPTKEGKPIIFAIMEDNTKYLMREEFSMEAFDTFINSLIDKSAEPLLRSQAIPEHQLDELIKTAVAKNFKEVVIDNKDDVLLEFHAPWCVHCRDLLGTLKNLAEILIDEDVSIVKMDGTENEIPNNFEVTGFPTLYWLPSSNKDSPVAYTSGRTLQDFVKFIAKHATHELKSFDRKGRKRANKFEL